MSPTNLPPIARALLWVSPVILVAGAFVVAIPWLMTLHDAVVKLIASAAAIAILGYAAYAYARAQRGQDEVQRAGSRFAFQLGALGGGVVTVLLLMLPPVASMLIDAANVLGTGSAATSDREAVYIAMFIGFGVLSLAQTAGALIVNAGWSWWVGRP